MSVDANMILERLLRGADLSESEAAGLMFLLTDESMPPALCGALLAGLRAKGETAEELRGFARAMRSLAVTPRLPEGIDAADCSGTGGDDSGSLNLSTGAALLAAACGVPVVKHGNRSVSSQSGSADVLEALGIPMPRDPETAMACLRACNFTFLLAPAFHPAMKAVAPIRGALAVRTVFNILGPLANPAAPPFQLIGAFDMPTARLMADAMAGTDIERAFVVHGDPGWDEATPVGSFALFDVRPGQVRESRRDPQDFGIGRCKPEDLRGGDASVNAAALEAVFAGTEEGPHRDALVLAAGLVLELTGAAVSLESGLRRAREALAAADASALLRRLRDFRDRL